MKFFLSLLIVIIIYSLLFIAHFSPVNAQQISLVISPPLLKVFIKPGKSIMIAYRLENNGDPAIMSTKVLPFEPRDNSGKIKIKQEFEGPVRFSLDNANVVFGQPFFMKTHESQQLLLRIRIPDGAPDGDYYYTLLAENQPPPTLEGAAASGAKATIGSNILITVTNSGRIEVKGKVALFDVLARWKLEIGKWKFNVFDSNDKIPIVLIVENNGKNLFVPEGEIVMKGNFGEKARYEIIPQNVLAESQRLMSATPSAEIDCDNNKGRACLNHASLIISGFFIGLYKLSTTINFGENSSNIFASTSFIAIPFKLLIGFLIALLIGVFVVKRIKDE